ncbi:hypothetical protein Amsp01_089880 [Amycolatopsis sp. NBRC 101858]|uniref:GAF domain-containing SpoIIE family protein phosphatase n=1 Tax=Amycolatopsis sp. NBRC 101858 TaxID=3032200 RepID=UPI0024A07BB2|nr:GAF domain-containing SpoIIE family protein phosphatase [Amycolatopsis sp. NBRC 101858]GLY42965.1 hypothetical protein Amsp01_089880 [Amycolatopsis sp. NBRC 101858]
MGDPQVDDLLQAVVSAPVGQAAGLDDELAALFGRIPVVFAVMSGSRLVVDSANPAFLAATGMTADQLGLPVQDVLPGLVEQGLFELLDDVYRTGTPFTARDGQVVLGSGEAAREAFFDFTCEPRRDGTGTITGVTLVGVETTDLKHAHRVGAEHRALLEQVVTEAPLREVLEQMVRVIESASPDVLASVLLADDDAAHLHHGAGPSLPAFYNEAIDGIATGEGIGSCGTAAHRREPVIVTDIATDPLWKDFRELAGQAGLAACWSTPILDADGRLLGTFAVYSRRPRAPQPADLAVNAVFARTAALVIERDRITRARDAAIAREHQARQDLAFVLETSTVTARELDYEAGLAALAELAVPRLAPLCAIDVEQDGELRRVAVVPAQEETGWTPSPAGRAMAARVLASGRSESAALPERDTASWPGLGVTHRLCVPLTARGRTFGVLSLLTIGDRAADGHTVALAEEIAGRAALHADNARHYTERAQLARDLQAGLRPVTLPDIPGVDVAAYYRALGDGLTVGGDFYDVFDLGAGRWAFAIGDVCGHGAVAATTTGLVRHTARAVAKLVAGPVAVVEAINTSLLDRPAQHSLDFVTLVYGHLEVTAAGVEVEFVRAGHLEPLVRRADGRVEVLAPDGAALGLFAAPVLRSERVVLSAGDSLVLVTDGLTEAQAPSGSQFGDDRLRRTLATLPRTSVADAETVVNAIVGAVDEHVVGNAVPEDDQAALVLTVASA